MKLWLKHPQTGQYSVTLSFAAGGFLAALGKFLLNGVTFTIAGKAISCGSVDAALLGAMLLPTLGSYVTRTYIDKAKEIPPEEFLRTKLY